MSNKPARKLSDQLRRFVEEAAEKGSLRQVARDTGIDVSTLSRILSGERAISAAAWNTLGEYLGLELRRIRPARAKKGR